MELNYSQWEKKCFGDAGKPAENPWKELRLADGEFVVYGAGFAGLMFLELLRKKGLSPQAVVDQSDEKNGKFFLGFEIQKPSAELVRGRNAVVCLLRRDAVFDEIKGFLRALGCDKILHLYDLKNERELFRGQPLIISPDRELIRENRGKLFEVYSTLGDEKSRETLTAVVRFLCADGDCEIPALPMSEQYFSPLFSRRDDEVFVDVGAHTGETLEQFAARRGADFKEYIAFEPDGGNAEKIREKFAEKLGGKLRIEQKALGNFRGEVRVRNYLGSNSRVCEDGEITAECVPLDAYCGAVFPTHIKIDAEGMDKEILLGGRRIITETGLC